MVRRDVKKILMHFIQRKKKIRNRRNDQWDTELTLILDRKVDYDYDDWIYGYKDKIRFESYLRNQTLK